MKRSAATTVMLAHLGAPAMGEPRDGGPPPAPQVRHQESDASLCASPYLTLLRQRYGTAAAALERQSYGAAMDLATCEPSTPEGEELRSAAEKGWRRESHSPTASDRRDWKRRQEEERPRLLRECKRPRALDLRRRYRDSLRAYRSKRYSEALELSSCELAEGRQPRGIDKLLRIIRSRSEPSPLDGLIP